MAGITVSVILYLTIMLSVRELLREDVPLLLDYWFTASDAFLQGMGVDVAKMPSRDAFEQMLLAQLNTPITERKSYCLVWLADGKPVGHSNTNPTTYGVEGKMHLHLWTPAQRQKGMGTAFIRLCLPQYFQRLQLQTLWCEPYALNPAPHHTLARTGFERVKEYVTVPGFINFEQPVQQWVMTRERFETLYSAG